MHQLRSHRKERSERSRQTASLLALAAAFSLVTAACGSDASTDTTTTEAPAATGSASSDTTGATADTTGAAASAAFPVDVENCGQTLHFDAAPTATVSMDQVATEALLGIGAGKSVVGTANQATPVWETFTAEYDKIPVLAEGTYPSKEVLLEAAPDLVVGNLQFFTYSGFPPGSNFTREELTANGINSFTLRCDDDEAITQDLLFERYVDLGRIFGKQSEAEAYVTEVKDGLAAVAAALEGMEPVKTFYYSGGEGPLGTYGAAQEGLVMSGGENLFADLPPLVGGMPPTVSTEEVVTRNPAAILVEDSGALDPSAPTVDAKTAFLTTTLASTDAVKAKRFCTVDFYDFEGGLRTVAAVQRIAQCLHPDLEI